MSSSYCTPLFVDLLWGHFIAQLHPYRRERPRDFLVSQIAHDDTRPHLLRNAHAVGLNRRVAGFVTKNNDMVRGG